MNNIIACAGEIVVRELVYACFVKNSLLAKKDVDN